jgi:hypothetical protein
MAAAPGRPIGQQQFQQGPFPLCQVMSMQHTDVSDPALRSAG